MGTYLYFGKISKTKTDTKIVISESGSFRPVEDVLYLIKHYANEIISNVE